MSEIIEVLSIISAAMTIFGIEGFFQRRLSQPVVSPIRSSAARAVCQQMAALVPLSFWIWGVWAVFLGLCFIWIAIFDTASISRTLYSIVIGIGLIYGGISFFLRAKAGALLLIGIGFAIGIDFLLQYVFAMPNTNLQYHNYLGVLKRETMRTLSFLIVYFVITIKYWKIMR